MSDKQSKQPYIPQASPLAAYRAEQSAIDAAINEVLVSGRYILGEQVKGFERAFAAYIGVPHAIGVASGTDALHIALAAVGIGKGDLVLTVSHTSPGTALAIMKTGAVPAFVDIDPQSFTMDPCKLEDAIQSLAGESASHKLKAIVPVHLYGCPADMTAIMSIAERHGLLVVEDCAQAHGAAFLKQTVGSFGQASAFSFYPTKNLGALGDGGMVLCKTEDAAKRAGILREYGWQERQICRDLGINSRLDELQAAVLRVKLPLLDQSNITRRELAAAYNQQLNSDCFELPVEPENAFHVYHQYVVRAKRRDELRSYLDQCRIGSAIHFPQPVHKQVPFQDCQPEVPPPLEQTERIVREIVSLPIFPQLGLENLERICRAMNRWAEEND